MLNKLVGIFFHDGSWSNLSLEVASGPGLKPDRIHNTVKVKYKGTVFCVKSYYKTEKLDELLNKKGKIPVPNNAQKDLLADIGKRSIFTPPSNWYLILGVKEVVHDGPGYGALPVFLQENIPGRVDNEQAVNHLLCTNNDCDFRRENVDRPPDRYGNPQSWRPQNRAETRWHR